MKRLLSIIMLIVCVLVKADAQYYSVNYDKQTVAAMAAAYGTEAVAEAYYNEQVQNILKHYNAAEVASAGIYAQHHHDGYCLYLLSVHIYTLIIYRNYFSSFPATRHRPKASSSICCLLLVRYTFSFQ
jgi:hypothetical protein